MAYTEEPFLSKGLQQMEIDDSATEGVVGQVTIQAGYSFLSFL
jgi:hypothetical protein